MDQASKIVKDTLDNYRDDFAILVKNYADFSNKNGEDYCDFFIDISSMMNGSWLLTADQESEHLPKFKEFDWYEILSIDEENTPEDDLINLLHNSYKIGYTWLINQLSLLKKQINFIEVRLYHSGSLEYQPL